MRLITKIIEYVILGHPCRNCINVNEIVGIDIILQVPMCLLGISSFLFFT